MSDVLVKKIDEIKGSFEKKFAKVDELSQKVNKIDKALSLPQYQGLLSAQPRDPKEEGMYGYKSLGHFLHEVRLAGINKSPTEAIRKSAELMVQKAVVGANEAVMSDGGVFVPPTFSQSLFARIYEDSALLSRTDNYTVTGNSMVFPRSAESSRATGSRYGGVQAYWVPEGGAAVLSRPTFGQLTLKLNKMICFAGITQELIDDSNTAMPQYISKAFTDEINFMVSDAIFRGTGAGQPQGIKNAPCKIAVSKETGQAADTVVVQNIVNMYARLWAGARSKAVWFVNQDVLPQLFLMTLGIGTAGTTVFMPPGGVSGKPYATLLGLPVIEIEQADTLGDEGDIMLVDLSHYVTITKGTMATDTSVHFYFDTDQQAFRTTFRIDGQPWWHSAVTPYKGTATQSMAITLAARA